MLIPVLGKFQRYQVNVEGRFDEDEDAVGILGEQLLKPVQIDEKKESQGKWWQFWK